MALSEKFHAEIALYCKEDTEDAEKMAELAAFHDAASAYLDGAGVAEPEEGTQRRKVWEQVVKALVLDMNDRRGTNVDNAARENPIVRQMIVQLKLTK